MRTFTSPLLSDRLTSIGRSDPFLDGSDTDEISGAPIYGSPNPPVKDSDFKVRPPNDGTPFDEGPIGTEEIHTEILSLNMTGSGFALRAGNPTFPDIERSIGEVESLDPPGSGGFPAESFFDIFVEIDAPPLGMTLFNKTPLLIENDKLLGFPPKVIYVHGNTLAVPVFDKANPSTKVGWITVAGHGIDFDINESADIAAFDAEYEILQNNPMPIPEPSTLLLLGAGLAGMIGFVIRRKRLSKKK
jgi:hypothetical protein